MGLFDFLKRKPGPQAEDDGTSPDYAFAHYALRHIALSDPLQFLAIAASPDAEQFMDAVLQDVAEQCGRKTSFDAASIKIHPTRVNAFPCAVVELPEPQEMAEAFMVAVVVPIDTSTEQLPEPGTVVGRYFTLEKGFSLSDEPRTVLAEWDTEAHSNYGDGPAPNVDAFITALSEHV
ncbi:hypothetical protein [Aeoliella sp. SH292]|uniref:hypothetical protein n=1 Tax=Aeoliella sp. SH292 TaxID=3454464 RepID=UPI003F996A21